MSCITSFVSFYPGTARFVGMILMHGRYVDGLWPGGLALIVIGIHDTVRKRTKKLRLCHVSMRGQGSACHQKTALYTIRRGHYRSNSRFRDAIEQCPPQSKPPATRLLTFELLLQGSDLLVVVLDGLGHEILVILELSFRHGRLGHAVSRA